MTFFASRGTDSVRFVLGSEDPISPLKKWLLEAEMRPGEDCLNSRIEVARDARISSLDTRQDIVYHRRQVINHVGFQSRMSLTSVLSFYVYVVYEYAGRMGFPARLTTCGKALFWGRFEFQIESRSTLGGSYLNAKRRTCERSDPD